MRQDVRNVTATETTTGVSSGSASRERRSTAHRYSFAERARRLLCHEAWNIGVVDQSAADIVRHGITGAVRWLPAPPSGTMLADPSCRLRPDGGYSYFAEQLDYRRPRGTIWIAECAAGADPASAKFEPLLSEPFHLSYPSPLTGDNGEALLTAESWGAGAALLWAERQGGWRRAGILFPGRPVVDPTLWRGEDRWWLFCTFRDDSPDGQLHLFHAPRLGETWIPHKQNPIKVDAGASRPAGPLFRAGDHLVRPAQDCSRTYGGGIVLHAIVQLNEHRFEEKILRRLDPLPGPYRHGLHTLCPAGDVCLIDGKRWQANVPGAVGKLRRAALRGLASRV